jgi:Kef-type K+ transport system membrane component KefB/Trk K+ transport system NAD-binding subunit
MEHTQSFAPLLIVIFLAFIVPILLSHFKRVKLPIVVGEIIAGILVGPAVLNWVQEDTILALLGNIGLAFLMFLAGIEIDFRTLFPERNGIQRKSEPNIVSSTIIVYALTLALAIPAAFLLNRAGLKGNPWILVFVLSATSLGVLLPILKGRGLLRTQFGKAIFISATLADFITVILLTIVLIVLTQGLSSNIFALSLLFIAFFIFSRFASRFTKLRQVRAVVEELSQATIQLKVRGAIAILLTFVVLAEFVDAELILGAFLAGMIIALIKEPQDESLIEKLEAFGFGFFIPVFFILVGVNLDLKSLGESTEGLLMLPLLFFVAMVVKIIPSLWFRRFLSWRETLAGGFLLNTHLSLEIAVAIIGLRSGLLTPAGKTTITLFAILSVLIMPLIFGYLAPVIKEKKKEMIAIFGAGSKGLELAKELTAHGELVLLLDDEARIVKQAIENGYDAEQIANCQVSDILDPNKIKTFMTLCQDDQQNLSMARIAAAKGIQHIVACVHDQSYVDDFKKLNVQTYIPEKSQSTMLALMARNPDVFSLLTSTTDERDVREIIVQNPILAGKQLRDLDLPGDLWILAIRRRGELMIPRASDRLELGDRLTILGTIEELEEGYELLESRGWKVK